MLVSGIRGYYYYPHNQHFFKYNNIILKKMLYYTYTSQKADMCEGEISIESSSSNTALLKNFFTKVKGLYF